MKFLPFAILPFAFGLLALLYYSGQLSSSALARGPKRNIGLWWFDLALGIWLFFASSVVSAGMVQAFLSFKGVEDLAGLSPEDLQVLGLLSQLLMWGPAIVYFIIRVKFLRKLKQSGLIPAQPIRDIGVAAVAVPVMIVLATGLSVTLVYIYELCGGTPPTSGHEQITILKNTDSRFVIAVLSLSAVVAAPVLEELFFRGFIQTSLLGMLGQKYRWTAVLTTSVFFGVIHLGSAHWIMIPSLILIGVVLGWVYERTGSLLCCIFVHMGFNAYNIGMTLYFF